MSSEEQTKKGSMAWPIFVGVILLLAIFAYFKVAIVTSSRSSIGEAIFNETYLVYKSDDDDGVQNFNFLDSVNKQCLDNAGPLGSTNLCVLMGLGVIKRNPHIKISSSISYK